jgi:hypothetical protein
MKNFLKVVFVYIGIIYCNAESVQNNEETTKGLGLLLNIGKIYMKKSVTNTLVGLNFPGKLEIIEFVKEINKTEAEIRKLTNIPALLVDKYGTPLLESFKIIASDLDDLEKILYDISSYHDATAPDKAEYLCLLSLTEVKIDYFTEILRGVKSFMSSLDLTLTEAKVNADPNLYEKIYTTVLLIHDFIQEKKNHIKERLTVMNNLANDQVPPQLPYLLDELKCLQSGDLENIVINFCDKTKTGLFCELSVSVHKTLTEYEKFTPIVYENVQLRGHKLGQIFVQDENKRWALIDCDENLDTEYDNDEDLDEFGECDIIPYQNECTAVIMSTEYDKILRYCNFTSKGEIIPIRRSKTGVLLQGEKFVVKEVDTRDNSVINILQDKFPVHIITNNNLAVTLKDREIVLKPFYTTTAKSIQHTYLTQKFIDSMKKSAEQSDLLEELEFTHIVDLVYGILFLITIPILLTICCCSVKNSEMMISWKENRDFMAREYKRARKSKSETNLEENAKFLREMKPITR